MSTTATRAAGCLPTEELERIADGHTPAPVRSAHLHSCVHCRSTLERIRQENEFLRENSRDLRVAAASSATPAFDQIPGYTLERRLGAGGQGLVFEAVQTATKRRVAIKTLREGVLASDRQRYRFEREVDVLASLRHPSIVTVFDRGKTGAGLDFVAMEFIRGRPINEHCRALRAQQRPRESVRASLVVLSKTARAVQHAHAAGVMHRDLKPSNILVDEGAEPRIIDFGLARYEKGDRGPLRTLTREFMGTSAYASPEQFSGNPDHLTVATDVYSLGVVMFESLTGALPYPVEGSAAEVERTVRNVEPARPSSLNNEIPGEVDTIVLKALSKEPVRRYATAGDLAADIDAFLSGHPIAARRESTLYRWRKHLARHRVLASAFTLLLVTLGMWIASVVLKNRELLQEQSRTSRAVTDSNIRQGRLLTLAGNTIEAEEILWPELARTGADTEDAALGISSPPDIMRPAWALFEAFSHTPRLALVNTRLRAGSPSFGPDGRSVSIVGRDGSRATWDIRGKALGPGGRSQPDPRLTRLWTSGDGSYLIGAASTELVLLDGHSGKVIDGLESDGAQLLDLMFSADGSRFLRVDRDGRASVWKTIGLKVLKEFDDPLNPDGGFFLAPDGGSVAAWTKSGDVRVYSVDSDGTTVFRPSPTGERVFAIQGPASVAISPDGGWLAAAKESLLCLWPMADPTCEFRLVGHEGAIVHCEFSPDSMRVLSSAADRTIRVWDVGSEVEAAVIGPTHGLQSRCTFSPDGQFIAAFDELGFLSVWETKPHGWCERRRPWSAPVQSVRASRNGEWAASLDTAGRIVVWELATRRDVAHLDTGGSAVGAVCVADDGRTIFACSTAAGGSIVQWGPDRKPRILVESIGGGANLSLSPDGRSIAYTDHERVCLFDVESCERRVIGEHAAPVAQLAFSPDGGCTVHNLATGRQVALAGHSGFVRAVCFSPDSRTVATSGDDLTIRTWDAATGVPRRLIRGIASEAHSLRFHAKGRLLFCCASTPSITVWDADLGIELATMKGQPDRITSMDISPDGFTLITGAEKGDVGFWNPAYYQTHLRGNVPQWTAPGSKGSSAAK